MQKKELTYFIIIPKNNDNNISFGIETDENMILTTSGIFEKEEIYAINITLIVKIIKFIKKYKLNQLWKKILTLLAI